LAFGKRIQEQTPCLEQILTVWVSCSGAAGQSRMIPTECILKDAALAWFGGLVYAVGHGPQPAPGEPAAERDSFGEVVLVGRLREAIWRLNPAIPEEARAVIRNSRTTRFERSNR